MFEQVNKIIEISGYAVTPAERELARVFIEHEGHFSLSELRQLYRIKTKQDISITVIKKFMSFLCEYGIALKKSFPGGAKYEHRHIGRHHDHLICSRCGRVQEFKQERLEKLQQQIAREHGFVLYHHVMDLFGICSECRNTDSREIFFSELPDGAAMLVTEIVGGRQARKNLSDLGIRPGIRLVLIRKEPVVLVSVGESRLALGRGLAAKISGVIEESE